MRTQKIIIIMIIIIHENTEIILIMQIIIHEITENHTYYANYYT